MNRFRLNWYNLIGQLNSLRLPKDQPSEAIKDEDSLPEMLAKLQAQITELKSQLD